MVTRQRPLRKQLQKQRSGFRMCLSSENTHRDGESDTCLMSHEQNDVADSGSSTESGPLEETGYARKFTMLSYLSLGCDADVELLFNSRRDANPNRYRSQTLNFISHAIFGVERTFLSPARPLYKEHIKLFVDGTRVQIPRGAQSLLIANIPSYGAGADPGGITRRQRRAFAKKLHQPFWTCSCIRGKQHERAANPEERIQVVTDKQREELETLDEKSDANVSGIRNSARIAARVANRSKATADRSETGLTLSYVDDRQLDIMAMDSLFHFISIKLGREARRLASGSVIRIELEEKRSPVVRAAPSILAKHIAVQCDGEAWKQARNEVIQIEPYSFQVCFILGPLYREAPRRLDANTRAEREFVGHYLKSTSAPCGVFIREDSVAVYTARLATG
ncbi:hypothetical protein F1559_003809 [Cyanidiococcus yangmingshanensis]|uniref:Diacylglycerol kinase accessory domain-containing protein n=1 Tax=Cyanidiococcus yangmingshanensis TaxID=2690220 RepID=A0A7J7IIM3_9RHOD|nr:hypothetical protein F1559_003809 [Cyanidiococcus yangmingshanensis]